jgi:hypothetical protein
MLIERITGHRFCPYKQLELLVGDSIESMKHEEESIHLLPKRLAMPKPRTTVTML